MSDFTPIEYEGKQQAYLNCPDSNHPHLIDLGLPSGTKWACCNVGATKPSDYGNYYAWGEVETKNWYDWDTYLYGIPWNNNLIDIGSDIAGTQYDAAKANWGSPWSMPTKSQFDELLNNCAHEWTTMYNVGGIKFIGSNGGTIFLPAAGIYLNGEANNLSGWCGVYWTSSLSEKYNYIASILYFNNNNEFFSGYGDFGWRSNGNSVRPVQTMPQQWNFLPPSRVPIAIQSTQHNSLY